MKTAGIAIYFPPSSSPQSFRPIATSIMEQTCPLAELPPAYSQSNGVGSKARDNGGFLYDDYAREVPVVPVAQDWQTRSLTAAKFKSPLYIAIYLAFVIFLVQLGTNLVDVPATQLLENIICQKAFNESNVALVLESQCMDVNVQSELNFISVGALLLGYFPGELQLRSLETNKSSTRHLADLGLDQNVGILVAVPYGMLSARFGRKAILALSILGMVASQLIWVVIAWNWQRWNPRYTWTSFAVLLIGGGESVAQGMVFAMVADVTPKNKR